MRRPSVQWVVMSNVIEKPALAVVSDYTWAAGGIEQFIKEFLKRAVNDFDCRLITWPEWDSHVDGVTKTSPERGDVRAIWDVLTTSDVIFVVTSYNVRLLAKLVLDVASLSPANLVVAIHTTEHSDQLSSALRAQEAWLAALMEVAQHVVAVSSDVAQRVLQLDGGAAPKLAVIENAARLRVDARRPRSSRTNISFIGRPLPQKGYHLFESLTADPRLAGVTFRANTVSVLPRRKLPNVEYSYLLSDDDLYAFYDISDLVIAPYLRADGWPLALLEAINCGVPVLGFDSPGVGMLLARYGQIVVPPNFDALVAAVIAWINGASAPRRASVPSWDDQIPKYLALLREAARRRDQW